MPIDTDQVLLAGAVMITAVVITSSVAKKLNLGSIVALLVVGMALGPHSPRPLLTGHVDELQAIGEVGVTLLLFLVGLDTQPKRLASMRRLCFGLGTAQYVLTSVAIAGVVLFVYQVHWQAALIIGLGLAMSSDAVALSSLEEHAETVSERGQVVMAVVIYQGFAIVPVFAAIPLLASHHTLGGATQGAPVPMILETLKVGSAIAAVYLFARYALPRALAFVARKRGIEVFTLIIVAAVFASAWIMDKVGLSAALGAFMVGMILSTSVFAEEIRATVSSLKGLLLGVFFVAIGMSINLQEVTGMAGTLLRYLPLFLFIKIAVVIPLVLVFRLGVRTSVLSGLLLAPFDEIAYVIFSSAHTSGLLSERAYTVGLVMISFSFVVTPVLINLGYELVDRLVEGPKPQLPLKQLSESFHDHVVVVGYSYVGRTICVMLERAKVSYVAFELDLGRLVEGTKAGHNVHYGDVTDPAMMGALAISNARAVIVTTRDYSAIKRMTGTLRQFYPSVKVLTAVPYLFQRDELRELGATRVIALMPEGSLSFGKLVLGELGITADHVDATISALRASDYALLRSIGAAVPQDVPADAEKG